MRQCQNTHGRLLRLFTALVISLFSVNAAGASEGKLSTDEWTVIIDFLAEKDIKQVRLVCKGFGSYVESNACKTSFSKVIEKGINLKDFNPNNKKAFEAVKYLFSLETPQTIKLPQCVSEKTMKNINDLLGNNAMKVKKLEFSGYSLKNPELLTPYRSIVKISGTISPEVSKVLFHRDKVFPFLTVDETKEEEPKCKIQ